MISYCPEINNEVPAILLMSHGLFAKELYGSAKLIAGENVENIAYMCLEEGDNPDDFRQSVAEMLAKLPEDKVVLVDLLGGTPCNSFVKALNVSENKCNAIAGMNLPMLLELIGMRNGMNVTQLGELAVESGRQSVCNITERLLGVKY